MIDSKMKKAVSLLLTSSALSLYAGAGLGQDAGFSILVNGETIAGDVVDVKQTREADIALRDADIQVRYDGFAAEPRLDVQTIGGSGPFVAGDTVTFQSRMNYPAYVTRGEVRIIDLGTPSGAKTVAVLPILPNGRVQAALPEGKQLVFTHRVYDERGRFDETKPLSLTEGAARPISEVAEEGTDRTAKRSIPVNGGAVTISGSDVRPGARVVALGETITPAADNSFVIQRILPPGDYPVEVRVTDSQRQQVLERDINIPKSEWFGVGIVDLTFGKAFGDDVAVETGSYSRGRLAFYTKGKLANGITVTASADTGEEDLEDILSKFDEKKPRALLGRLNDDLAYPVYGDDSTTVNDAPTSGKFYVRVEQGDNHAVWGDFKSSINGSEFLRNERTLYGLQAVYKTPDYRPNGAPVAEIEVYAAQPDNLPQREIFRGTGGSSYVLRRQDISVGSETLSVEVRDATTGRVVDRKLLTYGVDYDINYVQGIVLLRKPLSGSTSDGSLIVNNPGGDNTVNLVAQYEYTPTLELDGFSYGGRAQSWVTDNLRIGATAMVENTGLAEQNAYGIDLRYQHSETTYLEMEYAQTDGPGFGFASSTDGGLTTDDTATAGGAGDGRAIRVEGQVDLADVAPGRSGVVGGYFEDREVGFSTLDYQVTDDQTLWGVFAQVDLSPSTSLNFFYDDFDEATGKTLREGGLDITHAVNDRTTLSFGLEHLDRNTPTSAALTGSRTDVAVRVDHQRNDDLTLYGYAQGSVEVSGGLERNDRVGIGAEMQVSDQLRVTGEVSGGTTGAGARLLAEFDQDENNSVYFGYTLDPERDLGSSLSGNDAGTYVVGARRRLNEQTRVFGENTYDMFGERTSLTSLYGVEYQPNKFLTYTGGLEVGRVADDANGDFDRNALSFGVVYQDEAGLSARGRLEYRNERGVDGASNRDSDTWLLSAGARYKIDENQRLLFNLDALRTDSSLTGLPDSEYAEASLGYAYRPVDNDRLNILAKYTFLYDMAGQTVNGVANSGPLQRSHVFSLDGSYDLSPKWTLGGKIGGRFSEQAASGTNSFQSNDAWLATANVRYHAVHNWDVLVEGRALRAQDIGTTEYGLVAAVYRHVGDNAKIGVGYNAGSFSDDLRDVVYDDKGFFINAVLKF
ncbi:TonB-dependent receptor [Actibacterium lipolyticum]|uniref:TonB-dependent receptor n=1 Tax=Actibacterium lipolyticum TaxID=1524263 RepID=A0A238L8K2_9RHOB|nr:TonB-dependent receptor [Actibacterium lipolyticum]SMX51150.1 hypothetical protein COL8621_03680 [Actibacterium lipolyticum]